MPHHHKTLGVHLATFRMHEAERSPVRFHLHKGRTLSFRKWLKPIVVAICAPSQSTNEALPSSLQIEAFYVSTFHTRDFHLVLSLRTLSIFLCSGTNVTTTSLPPLILSDVDSKDSSRWHVVLSQASWSPDILRRNLISSWVHTASSWVNYRAPMKRNDPRCGWFFM